MVVQAPQMNIVDQLAQLPESFRGPHSRHVVRGAGRGARHSDDDASGRELSGAFRATGPPIDDHASQTDLARHQRQQTCERVLQLNEQAGHHLQNFATPVPHLKQVLFISTLLPQKGPAPFDRPGCACLILRR